ncbi:hypothetical protein ACFL28_01305 [Candidatus Omnitrophota bacterium]
MLYFIFTIDGDWGEYFDINLPEAKRAPKRDVLLDLVQREIEVAARNINGHFIHFIHTSSRARDFFLKGLFLGLWDQIVKNGGDTGLHCHEDDPYRDYYYQDSSRMREVISERARSFRKIGLDVRCYRSGFLGFSDEIVKILEENGIRFDFSCEPGRFLTHGKKVISDWRGAPENYYKMGYNDHCKPGDSKVWEVPLGASEGKYLYFERASLEELEKVAFDLKEKSKRANCDIIVSVLTHTYEYASLEVIENIEKKLSLLKRYGSFINLRKLEDIIA